MTQTNTQSVRSDAEAAVNTNRVPTFEEVYAMPYVQDSIRALIDQNVRLYPILASHEDDLRQEMLISLWKALPRFNPEKSSIKRFIRMPLISALRDARDKFFTDSNLMLAHADNIADYEFRDEDSVLSCEKRQIMAQLASSSTEREILRRDIDTVLEKVSPDLRSVAYRIMEGESLRQIGESLGLDHRLVTIRYIRPLRAAFEKYF